MTGSSLCSAPARPIPVPPAGMPGRGGPGWGEGGGSTVVAGPDFDTQNQQPQATMYTIEQVLDLGAMRKELTDLGEQVAAPDLWDDQANAQRVTGRLSVIQGELDRFTNLQTRLDDLALMREM